MSVLGTGLIVIQPDAGEKFELSIPIVREIFCSSALTATDAEIILFMRWCQVNRLNPYNRDCYLVKYDKLKPAQNIISKELAVQRAVNHPDYDYYNYGVVVIDAQKKVINRPGEMYSPGDTLWGGWCDVYVKNRKTPVEARVLLSEYSTGQSTWNAKKATMIAKVAIMHGFRHAFPNHLKNLFIEEELQGERTAALPAGSPPATHIDMTPGVVTLTEDDAPISQLENEPVVDAEGNADTSNTETPSPENTLFQSEMTPEQIKTRTLLLISTALTRAAIKIALDEGVSELPAEEDNFKAVANARIEELKKDA